MSIKIVVIAAFLAALSGVTVAQEVMLGESEALACLRPNASERGAPKYPDALFERKLGGEVKVQLEFTSADRPPKVSFSSRDVEPDFEGAVRDFGSVSNA